MELGSRFFALPIDILCCRASKKDCGMWNTSGSGLPRANKKKLRWRNSVGFRTCREKSKKWNWVVIIRKTAMEAALCRGKRRLWMTFMSQALSPTLLLIPCCTNTADPWHPPNITFQIPFRKHHHNPDFSLYWVHDMRWEQWGWTEKVNLIQSCSPSLDICLVHSCLSKVTASSLTTWSGPWMPQTPESGHCLSNKHWLFSLNVIPKRANCLKIPNKPLELVRYKDQQKSAERVLRGGVREFRLFLKNCPRVGESGWLRG